MLIGLFASVVLSTLLNPTISFVMFDTSLVNIGFASGALSANADSKPLARVYKIGSVFTVLAFN